MGEASVEELFRLIEDIDTCMLTTRDGGKLRSRPMGFTANRESHEFHLLTKKSSHKAEELAAHPEVNLAFARPDRREFVSVSGQAYLTTDPRLIAALWTGEAEAWFPEGRSDPQAAVIRVVPSIGEYWQGHSRLIRRFDLIRAKRADEEPHVQENRKVEL
ncbi:pyridoxamine 5'-phosphate oxidase family protein [Afifella pfennigii]|uniref:pyridoxamine 5'-phosphate oxidase family protein n=1 Tax=Afifella pfennigii TaxID=209897 RepID=UPI00047E263A|nr:pyridoxamine 5'-phosphate oxidase family protein [Afifella pfennigii]